MRKNILITAFILIFTVTLIGLPLTALSADISFSENTYIYLSGSNITVYVVAGSVCEEMEVGSTSITFTLSSDSSVEIRSNDKYLLDNGLVNTDCSNSEYTSVVLPAQSPDATVTVTPSSTVCPTYTSTAGGGPVVSGGGRVSTTPTMPTTTTGQVTATASGGGKTTLTTDENTTAQIELPADAVSTSTEINIYPKAKAGVVDSRPIPSGKSIIGGYAYEYTAMAAGQAVTTFLKDITLTFSYTDEQIAGFNEDTLKIYYWDGTQWLILPSTVDKVNNKIAAITDHFTYFVIFGESEVPTEVATPEDYGLVEGNLIRAEGDFDIFIISQYGYKRLFLNPVIFEMYGHLGSWDDVKTVTPATRDAFITSTHYRYVDEDKVYHLEVTGEDTGTLQWINMIGEDFLAQGGEPNAIFTINKSELDWYPKGEDLTSL